MKTTPKFAQDAKKKKVPSKNHITRKDYQNTTAKKIEDSLDQFFKKAMK